MTKYEAASNERGLLNKKNELMQAAISELLTLIEHQQKQFPQSYTESVLGKLMLSDEFKKVKAIINRIKQ